MPGPVFTLAFRVLAFVVGCTLGLSPGLAERIPFGPIPSGPIRGRPVASRRAARPPTAPITAAPDPVTNPAKPKTSFRDAPMQPRIVRDGRPGCGVACAEWIAAEGQITPGTGEAFAKVVVALGGRRLPVFIDSGGGAVTDAMAMGKLIRERHLDVAVAQTLADCAGCAPGTAQPRSPGAVCASACVLVLAAGTGRVGGLATHIGVHQMIVKGVRTVKRRMFRVFYRNVGGVRREVGRTLLSERTVSAEAFSAPASQETDDRVTLYLETMGIGVGLMPLMMSTPATGIRWLTPREETDTGLVTAANGAETLLLRQQFALASLPKEASGAKSSGSSGPALIGTASLEGAASAPRMTGQVAWTLETPPLEGPALAAVVSVPAAGLALTLRVAPDASTPGAPLVLDAAFGSDGGAIRPTGPLHADTIVLTGPPKADGPASWRLRLNGDAATLLAMPPGSLGLRLLRGDGRSAELTFQVPDRVAAFVARAEKAWAGGTGRDAAAALPPATH